MKNNKLYCPPTGNTPEELPDYCRFFNGVVRRDLQTLSDTELNLWGWDGPFYRPVENYVNTKTGKVIENDYDSETHKVVWYSKERRYLILPRDEDSTEYEIPYRSGVVLPDSVESPTAPYTPSVPEQPIHQLPPPPPVLWSAFKQTILESPEFNSFISSLLSISPIVALSFPIAISKLENGDYEDFKITWSSLINTVTLPDNFVNNLKALSKNCNLPQEFLNILGE